MELDWLDRQTDGSKSTVLAGVELVGSSKPRALTEADSSMTETRQKDKSYSGSLIYIEQTDGSFSGLLVETGHPDSSGLNSLTRNGQTDCSIMVSLAMTGLTGHTESSFKVSMAGYVGMRVPERPL